jgi:hypothetical protein
VHSDNLGEFILIVAVHQARYRDRQRANQAPSVARYRKPTDRRSRG